MSEVFCGLHRHAQYTLTHSPTHWFSETNYVSQQLLPLNHVNLCSRLEHLAVSDGLFASAFLSLNDFACLADPSFIHLELSGGSGDFCDGYRFRDAPASLVHL